ncbi:phosphatases II [Xylariaceae sp. FL0594]|nr:phosphatases II [Xylariaceae sp. FL0594]
MTGDDDLHIDGAIRQRATPTAPYSARPPSLPPPLPVTQSRSWYEPSKAVPLHENIDPACLTYEELSIITQNNLEQDASDTVTTWEYKKRREAQQVLDFLYLGPSVALRNRQWLREQGFTLLLGARDIQQAGRNIMSADKVAEELGIEAGSVDVSGYDQLVAAFPSAVRVINEHMLRTCRGAQAVSLGDTEMCEGTTAMGKSTSNRGKVLVFCETGNDRSASIVAAYLMAVIGMTADDACRFVQRSRFCVAMDDCIKNALRTYGDILLAGRMVHRHELDPHMSTVPKKPKRGIDDIIVDDETDVDMASVDPSVLLDQDRFRDRPPFVPFIDN